jgi:hypothetical protein
MSGQVHLPAGWFEVGVDGDPDRRRHWAYFDAIAAGWGTPPALFVTAAMARSVMSNGQWREARRANRTLRLPDDVIGGRYVAERPIEGLRAAEADILAHLLGGRLAKEKEIDRIVEAHPQWRTAGEPWRTWTESSWSLLSYSLCRWNTSLKRWEAPQMRAPRAVGNTERSVIEWNGRHLARARRETSEGSGQRAAVVFDV